MSLAGYSPWDCRVGQDWATNTFTFCFCKMKKKMLLVAFKRQFWRELGKEEFLFYTTILVYYIKILSKIVCFAFNCVTCLCCCCSVTKLCLTLCYPIDCNMPGFPVLHCFPEFDEIQVHRVGDAIQPPHPPPHSPLSVFKLSQQQGLFQWVGSSHHVAKVLELKFQHQSFQ